MTRLPRGEFQLSREEIVRALLQESGTTDPPTDPYRIANYLKLSVHSFTREEYGLDPSIRAFLWPSERLIGVHQTLSSTRRNFSILHEIGHFVLPGHLHPDFVQVGKKHTDTAKNMSIDTVIQQEIEANQFAADCLFQLDRFDRKIVEAKLDWLNIQVMAQNYHASIEATARRWIERTSQEYALVVFNPKSRNTRNAPPSPLELLYSVTSESFARSYFSRLITGFEVGEESLVFRIFYGLEYRDPPEDILRVAMPDESELTFSMRLFSNSYRMFGLLTPLKRP